MEKQAKAESEKKLALAQQAALELFDYFVEICDSHGLQYILIGDALLSAELSEGYLPWVSTIDVALPIKQYSAFVDLLQKKTNHDEIYLINKDNCEQYYEYYSQLKKRSRVRLGEGREKDEIYYDYFINVRPIWYVGDVRREAENTYKTYKHYMKCYNTFALEPDKKWKIDRKRIVQSHYLKAKGRLETDKLEQLLFQYDEKTKYICIPMDEGYIGGSVMEESQYAVRSKCVFEGRECFTVRDVKHYLTCLYGKAYRKIGKNKGINKALLDGPEVLRRVQLVELDILVEIDRICRKHNIKYVLGAGTVLGAVRHKGFIPWDDDIDVFMPIEDYLTFLDIAEKEIDQEKFFLKTQKSDTDNNLAFAQLKRNGTTYMKANREQFDTHPGILVDIFPLFNSPKTVLLRQCQDMICKFYRTVLWSHMGITSMRRGWTRIFYLCTSKISNKTAYDLFFKHANKVKKKTDYLTYFFYNRNYFENPVNHRKNYEDVLEIEFENHLFYVMREWDAYLRYTYSDDYMKYPELRERVSQHLPAVIDLGGLHPLDEEE